MPSFFGILYPSTPKSLCQWWEDEHDEYVGKIMCASNFLVDPSGSPSLFLQTNREVTDDDGYVVSLPSYLYFPLDMIFTIPECLCVSLSLARLGCQCGAMKKEREYRMKKMQRQSEWKKI